jgi:hypothetical protein
MDMLLYGDSRLSPELDARVRKELREGEQLLWVGQPLPRRFSRQALPIVIFGIPWTAFALFWMAMASGIVFGGFQAGNGAFGLVSLLFPLFGLPFVLIGIGMLSSPYWMRRRAMRTCYALSDRRAILWEPGWSSSVEVRSYGPAELAKMRRVDYADGSGDLIFEEVVSVGRDSDGHRTTHTRRHGFIGIDRVREIEELLRKALLPAND